MPFQAPATAVRHQRPDVVALGVAPVGDETGLFGAEVSALLRPAVSLGLLASDTALKRYFHEGVVLVVVALRGSGQRHTSVYDGHMQKRIALVGLPLIACAVVATSCGRTTDTVDGKQQVSVPGTSVPCYLLEVDTDDAAGKERAENYVCVEKAVWDKNKVGEEFRP